MRQDLTADLDAALGREWLRQAAKGTEERLVFRGSDGHPLPKGWWNTGAEILSVTTDQGTRVWARSQALAGLNDMGGAHHRAAAPNAPASASPRAPQVGHYTRCQRCGKPLTGDVPSRQRGYGNDCWDIARGAPRPR